MHCDASWFAGTAVCPHDPSEAQRATVRSIAQDTGSGGGGGRGGEGTTVLLEGVSLGLPTPHVLPFSAFLNWARDAAAGRGPGRQGKAGFGLGGCWVARGIKGKPVDMGWKPAPRPAQDQETGSQRSGGSEFAILWKINALPHGRRLRSFEDINVARGCSREMKGRGHCQTLGA
jgi:hypothetical protein